MMERDEFKEPHPARSTASNDRDRSLDRRTLLATGLALTAGQLLSTPASASGANRFKAIAFDAFPIFDTRPITALAETLFPNAGGELMKAWRIRQFEYAWLRALSNRYTDFTSITDDSLIFSAKMLNLTLTADKRKRLTNAYTELKAWPDALPALLDIKNRGIKLSILSNFSPSMLDGCIKASGMSGMFDHVLSTDSARTYKPDPRAYQLGVDTLNLQREDILFVAFAGWDAAGAAAFGYPTFWVNRLEGPPEELGNLPEATGKDLSDLVAFLST